MADVTSSNDFSTNRCSESTLTQTGSILDGANASRHPDFGFNDGNLAVLAGKYYFLVHQGLLCRHSPVLEKLLVKNVGSALALAESGNPSPSRLIDGRRVLQVQDSPEDMLHFLKALYDGITDLKYDCSDFRVVSALLRLFTKYQVDRLRVEALRGLSQSWPSTLSEWELRETRVTDSAGIYAPRLALPHPILVIKLAHEIRAPELLPSALYDLSRCLPSDAALGYTGVSTSAETTTTTCQLSQRELLSVLRGREHASRFLSTFIVNELEGREPSRICVHQGMSSRACQVAFETITFELLRDVNGVVCNRNSDPLYAIAEAELMQTREDVPGMENKAVYRACEACRAEFGAVVDAAREEMWRKLPCWFGLEIPGWGV